MARRIFLTILAFALASGLGFGTGHASAAPVSCGQTITSNTTLQADLSCTGDGLIIGSDGITLNLGHHTITGDGDPGDVGVSNEAGHDDVTVRKGTTENFGVGVAVAGADRNLISMMRTLGGAYGIVVNDSRHMRLEQNLAYDNDLEGITVAGGGGNLTENVASANGGDGIISLGATGGHTLRRNEASANAGDGIVASGTLFRNRATDNALSGIVADGILQGNEALRNGVDGIVAAGFVRGSRAIHNGRDGISLDCLSGSPGYGNVASENGRDGMHLLRCRGNNQANLARAHDHEAARNGRYGIFLEDSRFIELSASTPGNLDGIHLESSHQNRIIRVLSAGNDDDGIELIDSNDNLIRHTDASDNGDDGIAISNSDRNYLRGNHADGNGSDGIFVDIATIGTRIFHDRARGNSDDGIDVRSADATLTENRGNGNVDLGIEAVPGVTDGGGNAASGNGNPAQCANVACSP